MTQFTLEFQNQKIALRAQADPKVAQQTFELVQRLLEDAEARISRNAPPHHLTLLALLDLAEEYISAKRRTEEYQVEMTAQAARILELLDQRKDA